LAAASWFCFVFALLMAWAEHAGAEEPYRVVVLEPATPTAREGELLTRLKGELGAAGFEVLSLSLPLGADPEHAVAVQGNELDPVATFAVAELAADPEAPRDAGSRLQLWLSDRIQGVTLRQVGRDRGDGSQAANLLAVQGVELLQARVADWRWQPEPQPLRAEPAPAPAPVQDQARVTATVDLGVFLEAASGDAALTPLARLSYSDRVNLGFDAELGARLSVAGLGRATVLQASLREVEVGQNFAMLEGVFGFSPEGWLRPFASLGGGAYRVTVEGVGGQQAIGRSDATWSAAGVVGAGLSAHPFGPLVCKLEAQGLFALRPTTVQIDEADVASFGRPLLVFSFGVGASL
jgi:hypothetical protein